MGKHARKKKLITASAVLALSPCLLLAHHHHNAGHHPGSLTRHADCTLRVPRSPLTARGLSSPYQLGDGTADCSEGNPATAAFVQATIYDPATGNLTVYNPVVKTAGQPLSGPEPPRPDLPRHAVVTIWTGFNGDTLHLTGPGARDFTQFAQQSYANSPGFFTAVNRGIRHGLVSVPPLGTSPVDGMACPSSRDFSIVDQDQSDNNPEAYPAYGVSNGSDEGLLGLVDKALGCAPWTVPVLDPAIGGTAASPSGPVQEIQAARYQAAPVALVPGTDPFVLRNGQPSLYLQNLYRANVDQPSTWRSGGQAYCANLASAGAARLKADATTEAAYPPPLPIGSNLATVLAARFAATWGNLGCGGPSPITVTTDGNGVAVAATYPQ